MRPRYHTVGSFVASVEQRYNVLRHFFLYWSGRYLSFSSFINFVRAILQVIYVENSTNSTHHISGSLDQISLFFELKQIEEKVSSKLDLFCYCPWVRKISRTLKVKFLPMYRVCWLKGMDGRRAVTLFFVSLNMTTERYFGCLCLFAYVK